MLSGTRCVAPNAPTNLDATNSSSSVNNLSWTDNSSNELGFKVYRALNGGSYVQTATTTVNAVSYSNTGLAADQTYSYYVAAYNSAGETNSNVARTITYTSVPAAPSNLTAALVSNNVTLTWTDNSTNEDTFSVERATLDNVFSVIATTTLNLTSSTSYTDVAVGQGTYYYRIRALNSIGASAYSNVAAKADASGDSYASIAFDNASSTSTPSQTSVTIPLAVSTTGTNRILFAGISTGSTSVSSVTYNGQALTLIGSDHEAYHNTYAYLY